MSYVVFWNVLYIQYSCMALPRGQEGLQAGRKPSSKVLCQKGMSKRESIVSQGELFFCVPLDELPGEEAGCTHCPLTMHALVLSPLANVHLFVLISGPCASVGLVIHVQEVIVCKC